LQNKGDENMKTILVRLGIGIMLTCIVGMLAGCAGQPTQAKSAPSYATFVITFQPDPPARPTGMEIQPDDGNVVLEVVKRPGPDDNKVVWQSAQKFSIRFGQLCDPSQPLPRGGELGDEGKDWNVAKEKDKVWEYTLNLKQGNGPTKETVSAKYSVRHCDPGAKHCESGVEFDPIIIVGR
jgi:hypothetical protein